MFKLADGATVGLGDKAFNYYDMKPGSFIEPPDEDGWAFFDHEDGSRKALNGERVCSLRHARSMGWL